jgi:hypothetical protein
METALNGRPAIEKSQDIGGIHRRGQQHIIACATIKVVRQAIPHNRFTAKAARYCQGI